MFLHLTFVSQMLKPKAKLQLHLQSFPVVVFQNLQEEAVPCSTDKSLEGERKSDRGGEGKFVTWGIPSRRKDTAVFDPAVFSIKCLWQASDCARQKSHG